MYNISCIAYTVLASNIYMNIKPYAVIVHYYKYRFKSGILKLFASNRKLFGILKKKITFEFEFSVLGLVGNKY